MITLAFGRFLNNYEDLSKFCALNLSAMNIWTRLSREDIANLAEEYRQSIGPLVDVGHVGKTIATNLAIVHLVVIMEAYVQDGVKETIDRWATRIVNALFPGDEFENAFAESVTGQKRESSDTFAPVAELAREQVKFILRQTPVENGVKLLTKYFGAAIKDEQIHLVRWQEIKLRRNCIVHNEGRADKKYADFTKKNSGYFPVIEANELLIADSDYIVNALKYVRNFAEGFENCMVEVLILQPRG